MFLLLSACKQVQDEAADETTPASVQISYKGALPPVAIARLRSGTINVLELSPDDRTIADGGDVGLYLYDAEIFEEVWSIPSSSPIISLAFSPEGGILATGIHSPAVSKVKPFKGTVI